MDSENVFVEATKQYPFKGKNVTLICLPIDIEKTFQLLDEYFQSTFRPSL